MGSRPVVDDGGYQASGRVGRSRSPGVAGTAACPDHRGGRDGDRPRSDANAGRVARAAPSGSVVADAESRIRLPTPPSMTPTPRLLGDAGGTRRVQLLRGAEVVEGRGAREGPAPRRPQRTLIVEAIETGEPIGTVGGHGLGYRPNSASRAWNIGTGIPSARGRGYGGEAERELADQLFRTTHATRVEALMDVENIREQRCREGRLQPRRGSSAAPRCAPAVSRPRDPFEASLNP